MMDDKGEIREDKFQGGIPTSDRDKQSQHSPHGGRRYNSTSHPHENTLDRKEETVYSTGEVESVGEDAG